MTAIEDEIERLSQALALVEGFQLLVLECHELDTAGLHAILDRVQARVAALRGVPPLIVTYDPHLTTDAEGSLRDEAWTTGILEPILELSAAALAPEGQPWPFPDAKPEPGLRAHEGASIVALIDGTAAARDDSELHSWAFLFQRINERRNALAREFQGTLALALPPDLVRLFFEEAPDAASIRSGHFELRPVAPSKDAPRTHDLLRWYPAHLVREAALRRLASDPRLSGGARNELAHDLHRPEVERYWLRNSNGAHIALHTLLRGLFSTDELRRFAEMYLDPALAHGLPGPGTSADELAAALIERTLTHGAERSLFESLVRAFPRRYADIAGVASTWGHSLQPYANRGVATSQSELIDVLLLLPRERLEQVVLLANIHTDGPPTRTSVHAAKALARLPVRQIVAQAAAEGPDALKRLWDAVRLIGSLDSP